jgi:hypothetical protein
MQARMYLPAYGRFAQPDPEKPFDFSDPQSFNLYAYCMNNPVVRTDPTGMDIVFFIWDPKQTSSGAGHVAVAIGEGNKWRWFEACNDSPGKTYGPLTKSGFQNSDGSPIIGASPIDLAKRSIDGNRGQNMPKFSVTVKTFSETTDAMTKSAADWVSAGLKRPEDKQYDGRSNFTCVGLGEAAAIPIGFKPTWHFGSADSPNDFWSDLKIWAGPHLENGGDGTVSIDVNAENKDQTPSYSLTGMVERAIGVKPEE